MRANQKKGRGVSVKDILDNAYDDEKSGNIDEILVIAIGAGEYNGMIKHGYSSDSILYLLGAIEYVKSDLVDLLGSMQEEGDD